MCNLLEVRSRGPPTSNSTQTPSHSDQSPSIFCLDSGTSKLPNGMGRTCRVVYLCVWWTYPPQVMLQLPCVFGVFAELQFLNVLWWFASLSIDELVPCKRCCTTSLCIIFNLYLVNFAALLLGFLPSFRLLLGFQFLCFLMLISFWGPVVLF